MPRNIVFILCVALLTATQGMSLFATANESASVSNRDATVLVEAESFGSYGGWGLDTQFIRNMGSPYLIAHGLGKPVEDAVTKVELPETGLYHVYARTKDWVAKWNAPGTPGRFGWQTSSQ